jgi:hypothetical protein
MAKVQDFRSSIKETRMKKFVMVLMAATLLTASLPGFAMAHSGSHDPADLQCAKDCELLLKDCAQDVDTIQQKIRKLQAAVNKQGAKPETVAEVKLLRARLDDAKQLLQSLEKGGH